MRARTVSCSVASFPCFFFLLVLFFSCSASQEQQVVGHGYDLRSVGVDPSGKTLTAELGLIQETSVYGADIPKLSLLARLASDAEIDLGRSSSGKRIL